MAETSGVIQSLKWIRGARALLVYVGPTTSAVEVFLLQFEGMDEGERGGHKAMAQLNEDQRLAVGLVLVEGLPYKEAAEVLGIPIGTLTSRLARARDSLQAILSGTAGASV